MRRSILILAVLVLAGCGRQNDAVVDPEPPDQAVGIPFPEQIVTSVSVTPPAFRPGETTRIDVSVHNRGSQPITLQFNHGCMIAFQVRDASGALVAPIGVACTADMPQMRLEVGETRTQEFTWKGDRYDLMTGANHLLPPGIYQLRGGLDAFHFDRGSEPVAVELLAP